VFSRENLAKRGCHRADTAGGAGAGKRVIVDGPYTKGHFAIPGEQKSGELLTEKVGTLEET